MLLFHFVKHKEAVNKLNELVSVIIPAYNVDKYISQCVKSVLSQTYKNLEIIIVNDGSVDDTERICYELSLSDNRVTLINQDNKGLAVARNVGYGHSHGNWICYLDSDDWIEDGFIEALLNLALQFDADITACNSRNVNELGQVLRTDNDTFDIYEYKGKAVINNLYQSCHNIRFEVWNKLWRRELVDEIHFIEGQVSEDVHYDRIAFMRANKIVYTDTTLHNYRIQRPGNTNSSFKIARLCIFDEFDLWIRELRDKGWTHEVQQVSAIVCDMTSKMYYEARRTRQEKAILERLRFEHNKFYSYVKETEIDRFKYRLFSLYPTIYYIILRIYKFLFLICTDSFICPKSAV